MAMATFGSSTTTLLILLLWVGLSFSSPSPAANSTSSTAFGEVKSSKPVPPVASLIIFGDSNMDVGNNNFLNTMARANHPPYGIDYPGRIATGRFCNGRNIPDFISEYMQIPPVLPALDPKAKGDNLLRGINFASGSSGILEETGFLVGQHLSMNQQLKLFGNYKLEVSKLIGASAASELISKAIYIVNFAGNDYIINYFLPFSNRSMQLTVPQFQDLLISTFQGQLKALYYMGARKIVVSSAYPWGCIPSQRSILGLFNGGQCIKREENIAVSYNKALKFVLEGLNNELHGATYVFSDMFGMFLKYIENPIPKGFKYVAEACCGQGPYKGVFTCAERSPYCNDRSNYLFWDAFHATEAGYRSITEKILFGSPSEISPINLSSLIKM